MLGESLSSGGEGGGVEGGGVERSSVAQYGHPSTCVVVTTVSII